MTGKVYIVTTPDGVEERITNMKQYCDKHGLSQPGMSKVANGIITHHQGYFVRTISANENTEMELWKKRKDKKVLDVCSELVQTPYSKLTTEQKSNLIITLYAIEKAFEGIK